MGHDDLLVVAHRAQLRSQAFDVGVDGARRGGALAVPDALQQIFARDDAPFLANELGQDLQPGAARIPVWPPAWGRVAP